MRRIYSLLLCLITLSSTTFSSENIDYSNGVFFLNEDWFGHNNSTINFLTEDGKWIYRVYQKENEGETLGVTSQYATIYGEKMFIMSKQAAIGNESTPDAGRLIVADARTMKKIASINTLGGGDGRAFLGVDETTAYIGTSNGIVLFDIENMEVGQRIAGTGSDGGGAYNAQIGLMYRVNDYVFAIHQAKGLLIIDALTHTLVQTIDKTDIGTFGGMALSKDGTIWVGANKKLVKVNPITLTHELIDLPDEAAIPDSWFAWTADVLFASNQTNTLYWGNSGGFSGSKKIFKYEIDKPDAAPELLYDLSDDKNKWVLYHSAIRIHPVTDHIFMQLYKNFGSTEYTVYEINPSGNKIAEYPLTEQNYWFPALPLFPDNAAPIVTPLEIISKETSDPFTISLSGIAADADNMEAAMVKTILRISEEDILSATITHGDLVITPKAANGTSIVTVQFNSNGKLTETHITVNITGANSINGDKCIQSAFSNGETLYVNNCEGYKFSLINAAGNVINSFDADSNNLCIHCNATTGVYFLKGTNGKEQVTFKLIIK